jgi:hypothetical protein
MIAEYARSSRRKMHRKTPHPKRGGAHTDSVCKIRNADFLVISTSRGVPDRAALPKVAAAKCPLTLEL